MGPPEVTVVVVWRKGSRVDPICKEKARKIRQVGMEEEAKGEAALGGVKAARGWPWVPQVVREIWDKVWVSIDRVFEDRGSNDRRIVNVNAKTSSAQTPQPSAPDAQSRAQKPRLALRRPVVPSDAHSRAQTLNRVLQTPSHALRRSIAQPDARPHARRKPRRPSASQTCAQTPERTPRRMPTRPNSYNHMSQHQFESLAESLESPVLFRLFPHIPRLVTTLPT
ncbi:hypothetical protein CRG98_001117 [Punica granatum]|uniref:Uncharacterized protein n=1 Tax=Punica granatum TaxID=22663 RepID=A0A2I0LCS2_PUNGR|nr:hypothetical protein CRG98_001117 [Punica granatum]